MIQHSEFLLSEIRELEQLIAELPDTAVIQRLSLENRLKSARLVLAQESDTPRAPRAKLTFRGQPVDGSRGISAAFGGKVASAFADAFTAVVAGLSLDENLNFMGPIPDRAKNQLLITGTAIGSFGFEFELPVATGLFPEQENTEEALLKIQSLFEASAVGSDDELAELVEIIHPRAVKKIADFLNLLSQHNAWCGVEFKQKIFKFKGLEQLNKSAGRLGDENIKEERRTYQGEFVGVLPHSRSFEFQTADELIKGKIGTEIHDLNLINKEWLNRPVEITVNVVRVGQGRPRFMLNTPFN